MSEKEKIIEKVTENLPIKEAYNDLLHPALSTVGEKLQEVTRLALAPISGLIWGYDKIASYLEVAIPQYFEKHKVKEENITTPDPSVAVPTIEAMRYTSHVSEIREMFTNLLGASMDKENHNEHPAFVEIIKQLSPDECKMLKHLRINSVQPMLKYRLKAEPGELDIMPFFSDICIESGCQIPSKFPEYLDNLQRLGLVEIPYGRYLINDKLYEKLREKIKLSQSYEKLKEEKSMFGLSEMGKKFCSVCIS